MQHSKLLHQVTLTFASACSQEKCDPDMYEDIPTSLSAALLTDKGQLWLGSDETATLECLTYQDGEFGQHQHFHLSEFLELPEGNDQEVDIEGLDYFDHYLWIVGSHSIKRKKPKQKHSSEENRERLTILERENNRYLLARIPLIDGKLHRFCPHPDDPSTVLTAAMLESAKIGNQLTKALRRDEHLGDYLRTHTPGKENGFDIEGLAVYQGKIFLGLRGPVLRGWAIILELQIKQTRTPGKLRLQKLATGQRYKKRFVNLNGLGIRDLCVSGEDLLILAGPTMDVSGPVHLACLQNGTQIDDELVWETSWRQRLPHGWGNDHPEGFTKFQSISGEPALLVVYDSPAESRLSGEGFQLKADVFRLPQ